jgi:pyruvate formate lyase activating enzyme
MLKALIFDIKKFAIHDGPGIRTTVFFKGCPLKCWWCHNPESISPKPELVFFRNKCIGCGQCFKICPQKAHELFSDGTRKYHSQKCIKCGKCVETCYAEALVMEGKKASVEEIMFELRKDIPFYENSGGGITLSGGEPMLQHRFISSLLKKCKKEELHTALDTSGYAPWKKFEDILPNLDLVLYDIKQIDDSKHILYTGVTNKLILKNLVRISNYGVPVEIRMPIIPGINDEKESILKVAKFLEKNKNLNKVKLLPYHKLGISKYSRLNKDYKLSNLTAPKDEKMNEISGLLCSYGINASIG